MPSSANKPHIHRLIDVPLEDRIARIESQIREQPSGPTHRWALFQFMCITGEWTRAMQQLQIWAKLEPHQTRTAQAYRDLIRAERWRAKVVAGNVCPGFVLDPPTWTQGLVDALHLAASGQIEEADRAREAALEAAPLVSTRTPKGVAEWIADSDSRFGPVCEFITAGHYRWIPFPDLAEWHVEPPATLLDLIWAPCVLTLTDGSVVCGFMPARYPGSEGASEALRLGRETVWQAMGRTGIAALGQKTWATDQADFGLFELAHCEFGPRLGATDATDACR
ncbi:type VI secretion system accessory protein TagJ [Burkholderia ubonensis]|uniref:type VI secretion system accessory protein TagJ n=1 Tax=Burkholderia ubonensis TaxID=101571 RepID=UPI00075283ED|nr:type VI secretion system accessory protein TagJ [Burkholderia ubonensis]KWB82953.1 ImpE/SciE family protein [Burkholderia ubonensis]